MLWYPSIRRVDGYRFLFSAYVHTVTRSKQIAARWHGATSIAPLNSRGCQFVLYRHINHLYTNPRGRDITTNRYTSKGFQYSHMSIRLLDYRYCSFASVHNQLTEMCFTSWCVFREAYPSEKKYIYMYIRTGLCTKGLWRVNDRSWKVLATEWGVFVVTAFSTRLQDKPEPMKLQDSKEINFSGHKF
jgi:hypothetical protein